MRLLIVMVAIFIGMTPMANAVDNGAATPPTAPEGKAKPGNAKVGTSPPAQAGGAGVQGKSDAGAGATKPENGK